MDLDKAFKNAKWFAVGLLVLFLIVFIMTIIGKSYETLTIITHMGIIVLLIGTIVGCHNQTMLGPICGIIVSVFLIIFSGIIEKILSIFYLIDCIKLVKYMN